MARVAGTEKVKNHPGIYRYKLALTGQFRYAAVASFEGKQKWSRGHATIVEAEKAKAAALSSLRLDPPQNVGPTLTVAEFVMDHWLPNVDVKPGSQRNYRVAMQNVVACIGTVRLKQLNSRHVEGFARWMRTKGLSANTRSRTFGRFKQALEYGVTQGYLEHNPAERVKAPPKGKYHAPLLRSEDIGRLLQAAFATRYGMLVYLPIVTGLRESEVYSLTWSNLDFATGRLRVLGKGDKVRQIILDQGTLELLQRHRFEEMRRYAALEAKAPSLVFTSPRGKQWNQSNFYDAWNKIRLEAGLGELHYHDMRHVHSTLGSQNGVPVKVMQQRLGHEDPTITIGIYTDAQIEEQRPAAQAIASAVRAAFDPISGELAQER